MTADAVLYVISAGAFLGGVLTGTVIGVLIVLAIRD